MTQFSTRRRVKHAASDMFDLVADVERYPEFVPLCRSMRVLRRTQSGGRDVIIAEMTVAYRLIRESFTSRVTLDRSRLAILVEYLDGPFSRMENRWIFRAVRSPAGNDARSDVTKEGGEAKVASDTECDVEFFISYEFRSRTLGLLMGAMFDAAFRRFASAFEHRADAVFRRA
jgi:coenzyme Q-binding protein COQ10